jgi:hypothetical protein
MAQNSQNLYPIVAQTVPADFNCPKSGQDVVDLVQNFCNVQGLGGNSGGSFPTQDTLGQQALQIANQAIAQVSSLLSQIINFRASSGYANVPGDTTTELPISWTTPFPNAQYLILLSFQGKASGTPSAAFQWWVVLGSQTTTGCTLHFDSTPNNWQFAWFAILPPTASTGTTVISGFSPISGAVGTTVTIYGVGLTSAQTVAFNGIAATFTVVSDTEITATVPVGATTGTITVVTNIGTFTSPSSFTVT